MLTQAQIDDFHRDGFLLGPKVLSDSEADTLCDELMRIIDEKDTAGVRKPVLVRNLRGDADDTPVWQVVNIWQASDAFHDAMAKPELVEMVAQLTGAKELRIWHDQIQYKPAEKGGVNMWHQDSPLWPILKPQTQVSAWIALDDVDESNGCMSMVPGSHLWGDQIAVLGRIDDYEAMPDQWNGHTIEVRRRPVPKGRVHFHHGLTWHGSHANRSGRPRRAIAFHYMTEETWFDSTGDHVMKQFVKVRHGEPLRGEVFARVWPR